MYEETCAIAAACGYLNILQYARENIVDREMKGRVQICCDNTHTYTVTMETPTIPTLLRLSLCNASSMENLDILRLVASFVGPKYYRYFALISKSFHAAYRQEFPNETTTDLNASTVEHAKICRIEFLNRVPYSYYRLSYSAAASGSIPAMQYLRSERMPWDERTCAIAAKNGHLHVL